MPLTTGTRLGPYEILNPLGAGGMGEVYRARDTKLNRNVALKVLPEAFILDPDRLARFKREAQVLASLNHPNIAAIYGLEESTDVQPPSQSSGEPGRSSKSVVRALVLELVEGPTLADRLAQGPIPVDEALPIARQIAEALEAAHEQGIIHRDLKPANIKLKVRGAPPPRTEDGRLERGLPAADVADCTVKVLDFGLAKALAPEGASATADVTDSPTITSPAMTQMGIILGTAAYMSPEQAKGRQADKRSDIWAFGAVLYEILSGQRAFKGDDNSDTLAAVLRADPVWNALPPDTPQTIHRLLRRCLQKDPKRRLQHVGDVRLELDEVEQGESERPSSAATPWRRRVWPLVAAAAVGAVVVGLTAWMLAPQPVAGPLMRFAIQVPASTLMTGGGAGGLAFSPDGRTLVYGLTYSARSGILPGLVKRRLDDFSVEAVRGTEGGAWPFFSPNGAWLGFFAGGKLKKVPADGGLAVTICDAPVNARATWGEDGAIIVARTHLYRVPENGGTLDLILESSGSEQFSQPELLPGSKALLVLTRVPPSVGRIEVVDLRTRARHTLIEGSTPRLAATGDLLFARQGGIWATRFDSKRLAVVGTPVPIVESVRLVEGEALFAASRDGSLAYLPGTAEVRSMVWLDRTGKPTPALDEQLAFLYPRLSPNGERLAVSVTKGSQLDLWTFELKRGSGLRLTTDGNNRRSVWSPDGSQIAFFSLPATPGPSVDQDLYVVPSTGGKPKRLLARPGPQWPDSWSPDGRFLVFEDGPGGASRDLWLLPFGGDPRPIAVTPYNERGAMFSPDGRWLAFVSDESGRSEVYIQPFPGPASKVPISNNGGLQPVWAKSGRELYYREGDSLMAVPVQLDPLRIAAGRRLFDFPGAIYNADAFVADYDVAADGRVLAVRRDTRAVEELHVVLNWTEELRRALR
jgi:serine/threonine protein kinase